MCYNQDMTKAFIFVQGELLESYGDASQLRPGSIIYTSQNQPLRVTRVVDEGGTQFIDAEPKGE